MTTSMSEARAAKEKVKRVLSGVAGVSGIGVTWDRDGNPAVLVNVNTRSLAAVKARLSHQTINVPIIIEEMGVITLE